MTITKAALRVSLFAFLFHITIIAKPGTSLFSFHPFCMSLAYGVLMTEGVLIFTSGSIFDPKTPRSTRFYYHWLLNTLAGIMATVGFVIIYWNKSRKSMEHFITYHGLFGLICVSYTVIQLIVGTSLKYPSYLPKWLNFKVMKHLHMVSGLIAYSLGLFSLVLAFASNWYSLNAYPFVSVASMALYGAILSFLSSAVLKKAFVFFFQRFDQNQSKVDDKGHKPSPSNAS